MTNLPMDEILDRMADLKARNIPFVTATVTRTRGSTPRKAGAKMIVAEDGTTFGTVGGGAVETRIMERARELFSKPEPVVFEWNLSSEEAGGMVCGGAMEFLLEPFLVKPRAFVFGAGHVGLALSRLLVGLGFAVTVIDDRDGILSAERFPGMRLVEGHPGAVAAELELPPDAFCVVVNWTHKYDYEVVRALAIRDVRYIGLMASRKKLKDFLDRLASDGVPPGGIACVRSPVGLPIGAETPEEIAVSIAAEMIAVLRGRGGYLDRLRDDPGLPTK